MPLRLIFYKEERDGPATHIYIQSADPAGYQYRIRKSWYLLHIYRVHPQYENTNCLPELRNNHHDSKEGKLVAGFYRLLIWFPNRIRCKLDTYKRLSTFLYKSRPFSRWYIFKGADGVEYRWKMRKDGPAMFKGKMPVVTLYRAKEENEQTYLEIYDSSLLNTLDHIIVSYFIMERIG